MAKIVDVEGIGTKYADKLTKAGVSSTDALLKAYPRMGQPCGFVPHQGRRL
jgi:hypothetical protein